MLQSLFVQPIFFLLIQLNVIKIHYEGLRQSLDD